jgi:hypothetical protein
VYIGASFLSETIKLCILQLLFGYTLIKKPRRLALTGLVVLAAAVAFAFLASIETEHSELWVCVNVLSILPVIAVLNGSNKIRSSMFSFIIIALFDQSVMYAVLTISRINMRVLTNGDYFYGFLCDLFSFVLLIVIFIISKKYKNNYISKLMDSIKLPRLSGKRTLFLAVLITFVAAAASNLVLESIDPAAPSAGITALLASAAGVIFIFFFVTYIINSNERKYYKELAAMNETLMKKREQYFRLLLEREEETRMFRHDLNNHIAAMSYLAGKEDLPGLKEYISGIYTSAAQIKTALQTGNDIINAVLLDLTSRFSGVNFKIDWRGFVPNRLKISSIDLCTIFSNTIANAIEAIERMNSAETLVISVCVKTTNKSLLLTVKNPFSEKIRLLGGELITSKKDKRYHGFGTKNVKASIQKYGGSVNYNISDGEFTAELIFIDIIEKTENTVSEMDLVN